MDETVTKMKNQILTKIKLKELENKRKQLQIERKSLEIEQRKLEIKQIEEERNDVQAQIAELVYELNQLPIDINKIPPEILSMIFVRLDLLSRLRCRQVCRKWHAAVGLLRVDSLVVFEKHLKPDDDWLWPHSNEAIDPNLSIGLSRVNFKCFDSLFLARLRRLKVQDAAQDDLQSLLIGLINRLAALEELYIAELRASKNEIKICSSNLIYLAICLVPRDCQIMVNTPKLRKFMTFCSLENLSFVYAHQINELSLKHCLAHISQFADLRLLSCNNGRLERNDLRALRNLQEIQFCSCSVALDRKTMKRNVLRLLELKKEMRPGLRIIFRGVLLEEAEQLDGYNFEQDNLIHLLMSNYDRLSDLNWLRQLDFTDLSKYLAETGNDLPQDFHSKFSKIRWVSTTLIDGKLIEFLKDFKRFVILWVHYSSLKTFYSQLEIMPSFIEILAIERKQSEDLEIRLDFCGLNPAEASRAIALDVLQLTWQIVEKIQVIYLKIEEHCLQIKKEQTKFILLSVDHNKLIREFDHLEGLVRFLASHSF